MANRISTRAMGGPRPLTPYPTSSAAPKRTAILIGDPAEAVLYLKDVGGRLLRWKTVGNHGEARQALMGPNGAVDASDTLDTLTVRELLSCIGASSAVGRVVRRSGPKDYHRYDKVVVVHRELWKLDVDDPGEEPKLLLKVYVVE